MSHSWVTLDTKIITAENSQIDSNFLDNMIVSSLHNQIWLIK